MLKTCRISPDDIGSARPLPENLWFQVFQPLLLAMANTEYGRELLCIEKDFPPIDQISKRHMRARIGTRLYVSQFRIGSKWSNVIRHRWSHFCNYAKSFYERDYYGRLVLVPVPVLDLGGQLVAAHATSTFYPDPDPESTTVDGECATSFASSTWLDHVDGTGDLSDDSSAINYVIRIRDGASAGQWANISRGFFLFDTASIGADTIDSATLEVKGTGKADPDSVTPDINIYAVAPASDTALVAGDFDSEGATAYATAITYANWSVTAYNTFTLNSDGIAAIDKAGITKLGTLNANYDQARTAPTSNGSNNINHLSGKYADTTGTTDDPKLVVVHSSYVGGDDSSLLMGIGGM